MAVPVCPERHTHSQLRMAGFFSPDSRFPIDRICGTLRPDYSWLAGVVGEHGVATFQERLELFFMTLEVYWMALPSLDLGRTLVAAARMTLCTSDDILPISRTFFR